MKKILQGFGIMAFCFFLMGAESIIDMIFKALGL